MSAALLLLALQRPGRLPDVAFEMWSGSDRQAPSGAISDDGRITAYSWMGQVVVADRTKTGAVIRRTLGTEELKDPPLDRDADGRWTRRAPSLALSADGKLLARGTSFGCVVEEAMTGRRVASLTDSSATNEGPARGLAFSPDGRTLAAIRGAAGHFRLALLVVPENRAIRVDGAYDAEPSVPRFTRDSRYVLVSAAAYSIKGRRVAILDQNAALIYLVETKRGPRLEAPSGGQFALQHEEGTEGGFVEASGAWLAVLSGTLPGRPEGWSASLTVIKARQRFEVYLPQPPTGTMAESSGGRWLLVPVGFHFYAIDTKRPP